ncbi:Permease of the drug/metabolite transporter (DMT) superfamily [Haladaptatus litoreus]|uniref:Permease of the drug/metabolite transporter (DMT) superfamily n=1 Tax=Haladaptatus litoreus TaxID=553468 RepID=A0A1N6WXJ7_9EURY|nr:DMT family transporter [Haladaptatus litoreus]SIQ94730.1 Permease of the drug/metabolite transporter (DMT) superfamily [Haladaptatus litoreus]
MVHLAERVEDEVPPMAALAVAIVAVSTSAILIELSDAPSIIKAFYRVLFTTLLLAPLAVTRYRDDLKAFSPRDFLIAVVTGGALAAHFVTWFESLEWTTVAASVTLVQSQPLFVAFGAWALLDERVTRRTVIGIGIALVGMIGMSFAEVISGAAVAGKNPLYGNALAVVGAIAAAGYVLAGRSLRQRVSLVPYVTVVYTVCTVVLFGVALTSEATIALTAYPPVEWLLFLGMAVGPGIFGHTVINWALKYVESSVVSVSLLGEPLGSTLLALFILGQVPGGATILGGIVVLGGIYVTSTAKSETAETSEQKMRRETAESAENQN